MKIEATYGNNNVLSYLDITVRSGNGSGLRRLRLTAVGLNGVGGYRARLDVDGRHERRGELRVILPP